jgi:hypothetical protein
MQGMSTDRTPADHLSAWFAGRLAQGWFVGPVEVTVDRDEVLVLGELARPELPADLSDDALQVALAGRIKAHREQTRDERILIAQEAEATFGRKVAWGARCGDRTEIFTSLGVPVMTRLRLPERQVLDTLIDAGVARSRSEALAWCVRLVGRHQGDWIAQLRTAMTDLDKARRAGPQV